MKRSWIKWKNENKEVVATYNENFKHIYLDNKATNKDIEDFKKYLTDNNYSIVSIIGKKGGTNDKTVQSL